MALVMLGLALGLAAVHIFARKLRFFDGVPRSWWLSAAGGVSVSYVFVHLLPEIVKHQTRVENETLAALGFEQELFLVGLLGFTVFYGLERWARRARTQAVEHTIHRNVHSRTPPRVFWVHIGSFTVYNLLIGYLLFHREETGFVNLVLYFIAMALHLVVNDVGLRELHERAYDHIGKWLVATGVIVGGVIGALSTVPSILVSLLLAFVAGGVILNVIKEELPDERQSRFWAFAVGAGLYTALMIVV